MRKKPKFKIKSLLALGAIFLFLAHAFLIINWHMDDAFISYSFSRTFVETGGFSLSDGSLPSYGVTNVLWTLLLTIPHFLHLNVLWFEKLACLSFGVAIFFVLASIMRRLISTDDRPIGIVLCLFPLYGLACDWNFVTWSIGGLETIFYAFLILAGTIALSQSFAGNLSCRLSAFFFCLAAFTRPDGMLFWLIAIILYIGRAFLFHLSGLTTSCMWLTRILPPCDNSQRKSDILKVLLEVLTCWILPVVIFFVVMFFLTGSLLPSSYFVKVASYSSSELTENGIKYIYSFLKARGYVAALLLIFLIVTSVVLAKTPLQKNISRLSVVMIFAYVFVYIRCIGGDWMLGYRFFVHIYPLIVLLAGLGLYLWYRKFRRNRINHFVVISFFLYLMFTAFWTEYYKGGNWGGIVNDAGIPRRPNMRMDLLLTKVFASKPLSKPAFPLATWEMVNFIHKNYNKHDLLALTEVGFIPYYTGISIVDLYGLTDQSLAKTRSEYGHYSPEFLNKVWEYDPDLILLSGYEMDSGVKNRLKIERLIRESREFVKYELVRVFGPIDEIYRYAPWDGMPLNYYLYAKKEL